MMVIKKKWISSIALCVSAMAFSQDFYLGVDPSYVNELEDCGAVYRDRSGNEADPYELFSSEGSNLVRLRLWHNPQWTNYSNLEDVKTSIARAKAEGMQVLLDFHYSDFWADPGRQWRPQAWNDITNDAELGQALYDYTYNTLIDLNTEGLLPEMVQIGNETNGNILIKRESEPLDGESPGLYPIDWTRQSMLFNRALEAVKDVEANLEKEVKTIIHIADPLSATSWFQNASANGLTDFDIIGLSYYPQWHDLGVRVLGAYVKTLKDQYQKEVMIVETGYPWTNNSSDQANNVLNFDSRLFTYSNNFSAEIQRDFLVELTWLVKENGGIGVIYWEPSWISSSCQTFWGTGSHYENATLFDFDSKLHAGADFLSYDYEQKPPALEGQLVNFKVDMTGVDTENGVFVTGDFTGSESWQFKPMTNTIGNLHEYTTTIPGRSAGAYIFYNDDVWSDNFRETVPENCARLWGTHREYWVKGEEATFFFSWGRCDQLPNEVPLSTSPMEKLKLYPTLVQDILIIQGIDYLSSLEVLNLEGVQTQIHPLQDHIFDVTHLTPGLYLLKVSVNEEIQTLKFVKR